MKWPRQTVWRVCFGSVVGAAILAVATTLRLPPVKPAGDSQGQIGLQLVGRNQTTDPAVRERLHLLDPTPIFLPSPLSSSSLEYDASDNELAGGVLRDFPARLVVADWRSSADGVAGNGRPGITLADPIAASEVRLPFFGLGRGNPPLNALPERWAVAVVSAADGGAVVGRLSLPAPKSTELAEVFWSPLQLALMVAADGLVATPDLVSGSGVPEIDDYIVDTVRSIYAMGGNLAPGTYRLTVGP